MRLIRLLNLGRTLVVGEIPMGRYQWVGATRAIPKFGGVPEGLGELVGAERVVLRSTNDNGTTNRAARSYQQRPAKPVNPVQLAGGDGAILKPASAAVSVSAKTRRKPAGRSWLSRFGALLRGRGNPFAGGRPGAGAASENGGLDRVQVVRNDLTDSDFDVVQVQGRKPRQMPAPPPMAEPALALKFGAESRPASEEVSVGASVGGKG